MSKDKSRIRLLLLIFAAAVAWEIFAFLRFPRQAWIQGLTEAWFVSKGLFFYKDFFGTYMPFLRMAMVPLHQIFGYTQEVTVLLAPITSISTLCILLAASIKWLTGWTRLIPLALFVFWNQFLGENHFTTPAFLGFTTLLTFVLWRLWHEHSRKLTAFFLGLVSSMGVFSMQILAPFIFLIVLSVLVYTRFSRKYLGNLFAFLVGFLAVPVSIFWWLGQNGILGVFYGSTIQYHFTTYPYSSFGRGFDDVFIFLSVHSPVLLVALVVWHKRKEILTKGKLPYLFFLLLLLSLAIPTWFAIFHPVRFQMSLPLIAFGLGIGFERIAKYKDWLRTLAVLISVVIVGLQLLSFANYILPRYERNYYHHPSLRTLTKLYKSDPMYKAVIWVKENTVPEAKLFVIGDVLFYLESERLPVHAKATTNIPLVYEPIGELAEELRKRPPDYWVVDERNWARFADFGFSHTVDFFKKVLVCEQTVAKIEYFTIRKHDAGQPLCL